MTSFLIPWIKLNRDSGKTINIEIKGNNTMLGKILQGIKQHELLKVHATK